MNLPANPFDTIALTMSGGGFRATSFHLGALYYLSKCQYQGKSLLERVKVISTVSGGTFTGVMYAATIQKGGTVQELYDSMYDFLNKVDLIDQSLERLSRPGFNPYKTPNIINAFAESYYNSLTSDRFEIFWNEQENHLTEIIFNAIEFSHGINFRFQKTRFDGGFIGNNYVKTEVEAMKGIRLADIIASSSCFPSGFEPLSFPKDYMNKGADAFNEYAEKLLKSGNPDFPMYIMDGGIYDNQGIDATILANERMKKYPEMQGKEQPIDLLIISDVASPFMDPLKIDISEKQSWWKKLSLNRIRRMGIIVLILTAVALIPLILSEQKGWIIFWSILVALGIIKGIVLTFVGGILIKTVPNSFKVPPFFMKPLHFFHRLPFGVYQHLIIERKDSVLKMVSEIFLKQIRRLSYKLIYNDENWKNRTITNAIYELTPPDFQYNKQTEGMPAEIGEPSQALFQTAIDASKMSTTLWFEPDQHKGKPNMVDKLISSGKFTMCYNLIVHIWRLRKQSDYSSLDADVRAELDALYDKLVEDWKGFNADPTGYSV